MERYKELAALRCFTHDDMVQLAGSESSAVWQIKSYLQKGYIERVRRNLYAVISMEIASEPPVVTSRSFFSKLRPSLL